MKTTIKFVLFIIILSISVEVFGSFVKASTISNCLLPWRIITEKIEKNEYFCRNIDLDLNNSPDSNNIKTSIDPNLNYSYKINDFVKVKFSEVVLKNLSSEKTKAKIERYEGNSWVKNAAFSTDIQKSGIIIKGINQEGFYRYSTELKENIKEVSDFSAYFIVCNNWKKDVLNFCQETKNDLESNPDKQLFKSYIAISHFDKCMEIVNVNNYLSGDILNVLTSAMVNKKVFDRGDCPNLVNGLSKIRFKRFEGAPINQFAVFIPKEYDNTKKWPVLMQPDPKQQGAADKYQKLSGLIDIWWLLSSSKEYEWKDYEFFMNVLKKKLSIEEDKIYLYGFCDNGITAMALAAERPDQWAECGFVVGNRYRHLIGNLFNIPTIYVNTIYQEGEIAGYFNFAVKCFLYHNCRNFKYKWEQDIPEFSGIKTPLLSREKSPRRVLYSTDSLSNQKAYWVRIGGRLDENLTGTIDTSVQDQTVLVMTNNVDAYTLNLAQAPLDINKPVEINENGQSLGFVKDNVFTKKSKKYQNVTFVKDANMNGPVWDVFTDPYIVVWGSKGESSKLSAENKKVAKTLSNGGPCFPDSNFPTELINNHNLVLIGTSESNSLLKKIAGQLPVQIESDYIIANGEKYNNKDSGYILVYPNPMNSKKYVAVFSGASLKAISQLPRAYAMMQTTRPADVGIFQIADDESIKWFVLEKFDTVWNWHDDWKQTLANIEKQHQKWQWRQWFAKVIKTQLEADVVVCEDPFLLGSSGVTGQITYRDIFNSFRNDWIVKIDVNGTELRNIFATPFTDISKRAVNDLIIEGISPVGSLPDLDGTSIKISDIKNEKTYTIALPEKCLNGQRIGLELRNYNIVKDAYVVPLIKDYFNNNKSINIDAQLDSIKPKIF